MFFPGLVFAANIVLTLSENFQLHTTDEWKYTYYPWKGPTLNFKVKAFNDAHVIFATSSNPDLGGHDIVEWVIGGWGNGQSVVRREHLVGEGSYTMVRTKTPNILSGQEYRGFWITMKGGKYSFGKEGETTPLMVWTDPNPIKRLTHFGLCTGFGSSGDWKVFDKALVSSQEVTDTPCANGEIQSIKVPWGGESTQVKLVKEECFDKLLHNCNSVGGTVQDRLPISNKPKRYIIDEDLITWDEAKAACESKGLHLASVRSAEEQEQLELAIQNFTNPFSGVWIGANDLKRHDQFTWYDGSNDQVSFFNWENNRKPSRSSDKNCIFASYVSLVVKNHAYWYFAKCSDTWNYVCEEND